MQQFNRQIRIPIARSGDSFSFARKKISVYIVFRLNGLVRSWIRVVLCLAPVRFVHVLMFMVLCCAVFLVPRFRSLEEAG